MGLQKGFRRSGIGVHQEVLSESSESAEDMFFELVQSPLLSSASLGIAASSIISASLVLYIIYQRHFSPLSGVPGPFWASTTRLWLVFHVLKGDLIHITPECHKRYGKIVRIAPDEVSISDARAIKTIYGTNTVFSKTDFYSPLAPPAKTPLGGMFSQRDETIHARRRRIINNVYVMTNIVRCEGYIDICSKELLSILKNHAERKEEVDLSAWMGRYTYDVVGELFYGAKFGFMEVRPDTESWQQSGSRLTPFLSMLAVMPLFANLVPLLLIFVPRVRACIERMRHVYTAAKKRVDDRQESKSNRTDVLSGLFAIHAHNPEYTKAEIYMDSYDALAAGSGTTAAAFVSIFYHVMKNPAVYDTLEMEIDKADAQGLLSNPITYSEATQLPYLVAVCKEGMRVFPSVGMTLPRYVPKGGRFIAGKFFPEGCKVGINAFASHLDKEVFGDDAALFNPDRWFRDGAKEMDRYMFQFGGGSRTCIGKNISLCEIQKLVPQILRSLRLRLAAPDKEWQTGGTWFAKQSGVNVLVESRK